MAASSDPEVTDFIRGLADRAITIVRDAGDDASVKREQFRLLLNDGFDVQVIGRFVIGRYWKRASEEERADFLGLYETMILETYASRLSDYSGEEMDVKDVRAEPDESRTVQTEVVSPGGGAPVRVDWRVDASTGALKIVDVHIEGVSMAVTHRSEFNSVMRRNGGLKGLNKALARKVKRRTAAN